MKEILKKIAGKKPQEKSYALDSGYQAFLHTNGKAVWSNRDYRKFSDEAYIRNVIAHQSVKKFATAASSVKFKVKRSGLTLDQHSLVKILNSPNPGNGFAEFFEQVYSLKLISGNSFLLAAGPKDSAPLELHTLRPDRVSVIAGRNCLPAGYRYKIENNMTLQKGSSFVLKIGDGGSPTESFNILSGIKVTEFTLNNNIFDNTDLLNGAWRSAADSAGIKDIVIRAEGLFYNDVANDRLRLKAFTNQKNNFEMSFGNGEYFRGSFVVSSYERSAKFDREELIAVVLQSAGDITYSS